MAARLRTIARSVPSLMTVAFFVHVPKIDWAALQVAGRAGQGRNLTVLHPAPRGAAHMTNIALGSDIQRDVVGWHAFYAGICAAVASQAVRSGRKCRIVVPIQCSRKAGIGPCMAGLTIGYSDSGRAKMDRINRLSHPASCRICRVGMALAA